MIDEAIALDSSLSETPLRKLYDDTELVDNGNCGLDQEFDCLDQVVNDSEDEEGGNGSVAPVLRERNLKAVDILLESDGSNDHECHQTGKHIFVLL